MKKIILLSTLVLFFCCSMNSQSRISISEGNESKISLSKIALVNTVRISKVYFKKGQSVEDFCIATGVGFKDLSPLLQKLVVEIHTSLAKNLSNEQIYNGGNYKLISELIDKGADPGTYPSAKGFWKKLGEAIIATGVAIKSWACVFDPDC